MKTPKVILLRGKRDSGKTTTMNLLYWELIRRGYISWRAKYPANKNLPKDILAVLKWNGKKIGFISNGDEYIFAITSMEWFIELKVDIIVGVTRSRNKEHSSYRSYMEFEASGKIQTVHEEWTKDAGTNKAQQSKNSQKVALLLADTLNEVIG